MRIVRNTEHMDLVLDTDKSELTIIQRWKCDFLTIGRHAGRWTEMDELTFLYNARKIINSTWGNKAYVQTSFGCFSDFAMAHCRKKFIINPQISFIEADPHWTVKIFKARPGGVDEDQAWVSWTSREMYLTSEAILQFRHMEHGDDDTPGAQYHIVGHEFGHTLGNVDYLKSGSGDEYYPGHPKEHDRLSVMNKGSEIRTRHFRHIKKVLKQMCPDTDFTVRIR